MMNVRPVVSIIMPAYNAEKTIEKSITSVKNQTFKEWELIVVDDGSSDDTCNIVNRMIKEESRIHLFINANNMGVARTRNRGIGLCSGCYVAFLDSDDMWEINKLENQLVALEKNNADFCYTSYAIVNEYGEKNKEDYIVPKSITFNQLLKENVIGCSTVIVRKSILDKHKFKTDFYHEDYVLWLELLKHNYNFIGCEDILVSWCYRQNSRSFDKVKSLKNRWLIYRKNCQLNFISSFYYILCYGVAALKKYRSNN